MSQKVIFPQLPVTAFAFLLVSVIADQYGITPQGNAVQRPAYLQLQ